MPTDASASATRASSSSPRGRGSPGPNATSSRTVGMNNWSSGSWNTMPTRRRISRRFSFSTGSPVTVTEPELGVEDAVEVEDERGLAGAVRPEHGHPLALLDDEVDAVQRLVPSGIPEHDVADLERWERSRMLQATPRRRHRWPARAGTPTTPAPSPQCCDRASCRRSRVPPSRGRPARPARTSARTACRPSTRAHVPGRTASGDRAPRDSGRCASVAARRPATSAYRSMKAAIADDTRGHVKALEAAEQLRDRRRRGEHDRGSDAERALDDDVPRGPQPGLGEAGPEHVHARSRDRRSAATRRTARNGTSITSRRAIDRSGSLRSSAASTTSDGVRRRTPRTASRESRRRRT